MADSASPNAPRKIDPAVKWGAVFVIALMVLSGAAVYLGSQAANNTTNPDQNASDGTITTFTAEDVQGTVTDVFQTAVVGGDTTLTDKTAIDTQLQQVPGVQTLTSQFTQLNSTDSSLTYIANVTLAPGIDHQTFAQDVESLNLFTSPEIYFQAAVQVPTTLQVQNAQNQSSSITLPTSQIQGIVSASTMKNDSIAGHLVAGFSGPQYVNAYILETQNVSASPTPIVFADNFAISDLTPSLTLAGSINYFPGLSGDTLSHGIDAVPGVTAVNTPLIPQLNSTLAVSFAEATAVIDDVNTLVRSHPTQYSNLRLYDGGLSVDLNAITLADAKTQLTNTIQNVTLSNAPLTFTDPVTQFLIDVNVNTLNTQMLSTNLQHYFSTLDSNANVEIYQNGHVDINALTSETGQSFPVENGTLDVSVLPGHVNGDMVHITINAIAVRGKLVYVNGVETPLTDSNSSI